MCGLPFTAESFKRTILVLRQISFLVVFFSLLLFQHAAPRVHITNGKALQASASTIKTSAIPVIKRQRQNWLDASDDGFFIATEETR